MLSVIIPVYNVEKYLSRCLDSIIGQRYRNLEILIINDASPDASQKIIDQYAQKDSRINLFTHDYTRGAGAARNIGLDYAKGKHITFVDSDDFLDVTAYEKLIPILEKEDLDILSFGFWSYQNEKNIEKMPILPFFLEKDKIFDAYLENKIYPSVCNRIYKKSLFEEGEKIRFYEKIMHEDLELSFRLMEKAKKIKQIEDSFYYYFQNPLSVTRKKITEKNIADYASVFEKMDEFLEKKHLIHKKDKVEALKKIHLSYIWSAVLEEKEKFLSFFIQKHTYLGAELLQSELEKKEQKYEKNPSFFVKIGVFYLKLIFFLQEKRGRGLLKKIIQKIF